jgi:SAM-dependent methyltransferase
MALSSAILREVGFDGLLNDFCESLTEISILEINTAGNLTSFLSNINRHKIVEYPEYDMQDLAIETGSFDLVIHSDTLEHVPNPERALSECFRVLKNDGRCIFTVPIIVDRMTRVCAGLVASYHGQSGVLADDQLVITEFGVDIWKTVLRSGFRSCEIFALEYPSALAIIARK